MRPESYVAICCLWLLGSLGVLWFALAKMRNGIAQFLCVGGALFSAAAGACNGLVIAANGWRMPVEPVDWDAAPAFFDGPSARQGRFCRAIIDVDEAVMPDSENSVLHVDVPTPQIVEGVIVAPAREPRLAFLDDRHGIRLCGEQTIYSKGDFFGALGVLLLFGGALRLLLGAFSKRLRKKPKVPT